MLLSLVIPCYNEEKTLARCVEHVLRIADRDLELQIIIVDDCSKDASFAVASELARQFPAVTVVKHERNQGKGAAVRSGFSHATGDVVAIQDADLEYDPQDLKKMLEPIQRRSSGRRLRFALSLGKHTSSPVLLALCGQ